MTAYSINSQLPSILNVFFSIPNLRTHHALVNRVLVGKPEGKRPMGRPRSRWEDNIKMDLLEVGCGGIDWNKLVQNRDSYLVLVNAVMNVWVPLNMGNFLTSKPVSFSRRTLLRGVSK
jgi:hypothetical protein